MELESQFSQLTVEEYQKARDEEGDYATQAGILVSLLETILAADEPHATIARETAEAVLRMRATQTK